MFARLLHWAEDFHPQLVPGAGEVGDSRAHEQDIVVPNAALLFNGKYEKSGNDLVITGEDDARFVITGYFSAKKRPNLQSSDGAVLTADIVDILAGANLAQYAQTEGESGRAAIGRVEMVTGMATATRNGAVVILQVGDRVFKQDLVETGANSSCGISFLDGSAFNLTANCRMVLNEMVYSPGETGNSQLMSLVSGAITFVSGQVAKTGEMKVSTPVATMGIRGTEVYAKAENTTDANGQTVATLEATSVIHRDGSAPGTVQFFNAVTNAFLGEINTNGTVATFRSVGGSTVTFDTRQATVAEMAAIVALVTQATQAAAMGQQNPIIDLQQQPATDPNSAPGPNAGGNSGGGSSSPPPENPTPSPDRGADGADFLTTQGLGGSPTLILSGPLTPSLPTGGTGGGGPIITVQLPSLPTPTPPPPPPLDTPAATVQSQSFAVFEDVALTLTPGAFGAASIASVGDAVGGTVSLDGNGNVVFIPDPNYSGEAHFSVTSSGSSTPVVMTVQVAPVADVPVLGAQSGGGVEDAPVPLFITAALRDTDGSENLSVTIAGVPSGMTFSKGAPGPTPGTWVITNAGDIASLAATPLLMTLPANASGTFTLSVTATAQEGGALTSITQAVQVAVAAVNDAPSGANATLTLLEDGPRAFTAADFGFTDVDGNALAAMITATLPTAGSLTFNGVPVGAGQPVPAAQLSGLVFTPSPNAAGQGSASFTFQVTDNGGTANGGQNTDPTPNTITFNIAPVNDAPAVAVVPDVTTDEDTAITLTAAEIQTLIAAHVSDVETSNAALAFTLTAGGMVIASFAGGAVPAAGVTFTPALNFNGAIAGSLTVSDGTDTTTRDFTIHVDPVNDAPSVAAVPNVTMDEDTAITLTAAEIQALIAAHVSDVETSNAALAFTLTAGGMVIASFAGGAVPAAGVTFTPAADFNGEVAASLAVSDGTDTTTGTFTIHVDPVNDAPAAEDDDLASVAEDSGPRMISFSSLMANDRRGPTDEAGQTLTIAAVGSAVGGTVQIAGADVIFIPDANFNGTASFGYTVRDTDGADDFRTDAGTASFTVTAVNDAPVAEDDDLASVAEDSGARTISFASLLANDSRGPANESNQTLTIVAVGSAVGGTAQIVGADVIFTPDANFNGTASFGYTVQDDGQTDGADDFRTDAGSVSFTVMAVNDAPVLTTFGDGLVNAPQATNNTTRMTAISLDGEFSISANPEIGSSTAIPHVTIFGVGNGAFDFYSFTVTTAGTTGTFDIDRTVNFDSWLNLFDSSGNRLAFQDDNGYDPGSNEGDSTYWYYDARFSHTFLTTGTFFIAVGRYFDAPLPTGTSYQLHVSLADPVIGASSGILQYTENQAAVAISPVIHVSDVDNPTLRTATVSITGNFTAGQDILDLVTTATMGNITRSFDSDTGVLTLNSIGGPATLAQWEAALGAVTYFNTSDNPSIAPRTISYQVDDGATLNNLSNVVTAAFTVMAVNDPPRIDLNGTAGGIDTTLNYTGNALPTKIAPAAIVGDVDDSALAGAVVAITSGFALGVDLLGFDTALASALGIAANYNPTAGALTFSGAATTTEYQSLLQSVAFFASAGTNSNRTLAFTVNDGSASGNLGSATATLQVSAGPDPNDYDQATSIATGNPLLSSGFATFFGTTGVDSRNPGNGANAMYGRAQNDTLSGGNSGDYLYGGSGNDTLSGNNAVDHLYGGSGIDIIRAGNGADLIVGGFGADNLFGENGGDSFQFWTFGDGADAIADFENADTLEFVVANGGTHNLDGTLFGGGFSFANQSTGDSASTAASSPTAAGAASATTVVAAAPGGTSIAGADVIIWSGPASAMNSAAEVDLFLRDQNGTFGGGVLVAAYAVVDGKDQVGVYYDADADSNGGTTLLATLSDQNSTKNLSVDDFHFLA